MKEPEPADQAESPISDLKPVGKASAELLDKIKQGFKSGTTRRVSSMGSTKWLNSLQKLMAQPAGYPPNCSFASLGSADLLKASSLFDSCGNVSPKSSNLPYYC